MPHTLLSYTLGLLLIQRTSTAYERFWHGRCAWQRLMDACRDAGRRAVTWTTGRGAAAAWAGRDVAAHCLGLVAACEARLRYRESLHFRALLATNGLLRDDVLDRLDASANPVLQCALETGLLVARACDEGHLSDARALELDSCIAELLKAAGDCETVARTPAPLEFGAHTSRFLTIFCFSLPLVLTPHLGWAAVPASSLVAYSLLAIDEFASSALCCASRKREALLAPVPSSMPG